MYKIYLEKGNIHEATVVYTDIIKKGIEASGNDCEVVYKLDDIKSGDNVVVIDSKVFCKLYFSNKNIKLITWFQGIMPEEIGFTHKGIQRLIRQVFWTFLERVALSKSKMIFFVSEAMLEHYQKKYSYRKNNYIIMPCFNKDLNETSFLCENKYTTPTFVYAGSLSKWQCLNETIDIFLELKKYIEDAKLTILTSEIDNAEKLIHSKGLVNTEVKFVPLEDLDNELKKYKYGFLIREDCQVNNVATPTKLNTYIANGVIPIYSTVVKDFNKQFKDIKYIVPVSNNNDVSLISNDIRKFNDKIIHVDEIINDYKKIFGKYYNTQYYLDEISKEIKNLINRNIL